MLDSEERNSLAKQAEELRKNQAYPAAIEIFRKLWPEAGAEEQQQMLFGISSCLYKIKDYEALIKLYHGYQAIDKLDSATKNLFAWALYYSNIKSPDYSHPELLIEVIEEIAALAPQSRGLNPTALSILSILKHAEKRISPQLQVFLCERLDHNLLESEPVPAQVSGKSFPSQLEDFWVLYSKALYESAEYSKAIDICRKALSLGIKFHNDQDVWMRRRLAMCLMQLKQYEQALAEMLIVAKVKRDWFISHELAEIYFLANDLEKALINAEKAALAFGNPEMKIKLWALMQKLYSKTEQPEKALLLLQLQLGICFQMKWNISAELSKAAYTYNLQAEKMPAFKSLNSKLMLLLKPAQEVNTLHTNAATPISMSIPSGRIEGKIKKMLPHGGAGFIESTLGDIFFSTRDIQASGSDLQSGTPVSFKLIKSFDPVKNVPSLKAVELKIGD